MNYITFGREINLSLTGVQGLATPSATTPGVDRGASLLLIPRGLWGRSLHSRGCAVGESLLLLRGEGLCTNSVSSDSRKRRA